MRVLVLGGTSFVGRAIVADALRYGAELTLFGRGRTGTDSAGGVEAARAARPAGGGLVGRREGVGHRLLRGASHGEEQGHGPRHVRGRHRCPLVVAVRVGLAGRPVGRDDAVGPGSAVTRGLAGAVVPVAAGCHQRPLGVAGRARVAGRLGVGAGCSDDDGVGAAVVLAAETEVVGVSRGHDGHCSVAPGVLDAGLQRVLPQQAGDDRRRVTQAQVHYPGAVVDDPHDAGIDVGEVARASGVQDLGHHQLGIRCGTRYSEPVVGRGGGDPRDMRAMPIVVLGAPVALGGVAAGVDAVGAGDDLAGQILVADVDSRVDDPDLHPAPGARAPSGGQADLGHVPLLRPEGVVWRGGGARGGAGPSQHGEQAEERCEHAGAANERATSHDVCIFAPFGPSPAARGMLMGTPITPVPGGVTRPPPRRRPPST